jgi:hypothetical protein
MKGSRSESQRSEVRQHKDLVDKFRQLKDHHKFIFTLLVSIGIVAFWRGAWLIMDLAFFPHNEWISGIFSILLGLTVLAASGMMLRVLTS